MGLSLVTASVAHASTYRVYTATAANAMVISATDGNVCTLAEAVAHATGTNLDKSGNTVKYCDDFAPRSSDQRIELLESPNKPFATNHFVIKNTPLTLKGRVGMQVHLYGFGANVDSTVYSAFIVPAGSHAFFEGVTLTNVAGSGGGRLIENRGELLLGNVSISGGDVTGPQHATGRGGGIYNSGLISFAESTSISNNKARQGGGLYNDSGIINELAVTFYNNTATMAGGAIYNTSNSLDPGRPTNGTITTMSLSVVGNKAPAGGGIFNRAWMELYQSDISSNATITGVKGNVCSTSVSCETCTGSTSCDGMGGGVVNAHLPSGSVTRITLVGSTLSGNVASARGGAIYNVGVAEIGGNSIGGNRAADGAVLYVAAPTDGSQQYCHLFGDSGVGTSNVADNCVPATGTCSNTTASYSIISGLSNAAFRGCAIGGLPSPGTATYLTASGNSSPFCNNSLIDGNSRCPQPCGGSNQACCPGTKLCNTGLTCFQDPAGGSAYCR